MVQALASTALSYIFHNTPLFGSHDPLTAGSHPFRPNTLQLLARDVHHGLIPGGDLQ
jgi:hypothetical protein